jgi:hypothetical protein
MKAFKLGVVFVSALVLEIGSTLYINSVADKEFEQMLVWSFLCPFIALPFSGFVADEIKWGGRILLAMFSALGYSTGAYISAFLIS